MKSAKGPVTELEQAGVRGEEGGFSAGRRLSRREFLKIAGVAGVAVGLSGDMT